MSHNPNPFDFVRFSTEDPDLQTLEQWSNIDKTVTGYFELQIKALTPLHIVGKQEALPPDGHKISKSHFYRRQGKAIIPGSSIRGMVRSFIETACNGWVSQITPYYLVEKNRRNLSYMVVGSEEEFKKKGGKIDQTLQFSLPEQFVPNLETDGMIDLPSYLFGQVSQEKKNNAWRGLIIIEDVEVNTKLSDEYSMPDVEGKAFMGNPNPSAKTWWYHKPFAIRKRKDTRKVRGEKKTFPIPEFLGVSFWGRKFYYHQDPSRCVPHYKKEDWPSLYYIKIECIPPGQPFRIYFNEIPLKLLYLLVWALSPGKHIHHKLGNGKAYGYGSVVFELIKCSFRTSSLTNSAKKSSDEFLNEIKAISWDKAAMKNMGFQEFVCMKSIEQLFRILYHDEQLSTIFTYPKFTKNGGGFLPIITMGSLNTVLNELNLIGRFSDDLMKVSPDEAYLIAKKLSEKGVKPALHFEVYQDSAVGYNNIMRRSLD